MNDIIGSASKEIQTIMDKLEVLALDDDEEVLGAFKKVKSNYMFMGKRYKYSYYQIITDKTIRYADAKKEKDALAIDLDRNKTPLNYISNIEKYEDEKLLHTRYFLIYDQQMSASNPSKSSKIKYFYNSKEERDLAYELLSDQIS